MTALLTAIRASDATAMPAAAASAGHLLEVIDRDKAAVRDVLLSARKGSAATSPAPHSNTAASPVPRLSGSRRHGAYSWASIAAVSVL